MRFTVPNDKGLRAYVQAWDVKTGKELWTKTVVRHYYIPPFGTECMHFEYLKSMTLQNETLILTTDRERTFSLDTRSKRVRRVKTAEPNKAGCNAVPARTTAERTISAVDAFTIALGKVKGRVNILDMRGRFRMRRTEAGVWLVQLKDHADIPTEGLSIVVTDTGAASITMDKDNADAEAWLGAAKPGSPDPNVKMRPEVAFRKGIDALKWAPKPLDLRADVGGKITLSRIKHDEWFMDLFGYRGGPLGGYLINIKDDGQVHISAGL